MEMGSVAVVVSSEAVYLVKEGVFHTDSEKAAMDKLSLGTL